MVTPIQETDLRSLYQKVESWIAADPDELTREELNSILEMAKSGDAEAIQDLRNRFSGPLTFGTAGLRGEIGAGENRMNRAVVIRAAAGLSSYIYQELGEGFTVVIGNDARHYSREFAVDTAAVITAAGGNALLLPDQIPTPVLAFAVRHLNADAGVMVTASHNPPADNGYKVYLGGRLVTGSGQGAQLVPPYDQDIANKIIQAPPAIQVARAESGWKCLDESVWEAYIERACSIIPAHHTRDLKIVHTSMHGVGAF